MQSRTPIRSIGGGLQRAGRWLGVLTSLCLLGAAAPAGANAEPAAGMAEHAGAAVEHPGGEHTGEHMSMIAPVIFHVANIPVTNSMITGWLALLFMVIVAGRFHRQVQAGRRTRLTGIVESLVIALYNFLADILGKRLASKTLWLLGSFFVLILCSNWLGLFPGVGSIGWGHNTSEHMFTVSLPLLRGTNADLNTTLALGALFFLFWFIWAWQENGPIGILKHIFAPKGRLKGIMHLVMIVVFLAIGLLELFSILIRPFSLALRLYGNIFAGEVILETILHKLPALGWLLPIPFYLMEVLVGVIQALVFTLLSAVFVMLICSHDGSEEPPAHETKTGAKQHQT